MGNQQQELQHKIMLEYIDVGAIPTPRNKSIDHKTVLDIVRKLYTTPRKDLLQEYSVTTAYINRIISVLTSIYRTSRLPEGFIKIPINSPFEYAITPYGDVMAIRTRKILSWVNKTKGYIQVPITKYSEKDPSKVVKNYTVHRLVALAYLPNPSNLPQVNHIDGNKRNNHVSNLEWCSNEYNMEHAIATKLHNYHTRARGTSNGISKLTEVEVMCIRDLFKAEDLLPYKFAAKYSEQFNVSHRHLERVVKHPDKLWSHV